MPNGESDDTSDGVAITHHAEIAVDPRSKKTEFGPGDGSPPSEEIARSDDWLAIICDRFGIAPETFEQMLVLRASTKTVDLVSRGHRPPKRPIPDSSGMKCIHTTMYYPKITTQAAMLLGRHATRNIVSLDREQLDAYLHRRDIEADASQTTRCTGVGYVMIEHEGHTVGVGFYRPDDGVETRSAVGTIRAMYPKSHALPDDVSAFDGPRDSARSTESNGSGNSSLQ